MITYFLYHKIDIYQPFFEQEYLYYSSANI